MSPQYGRDTVGLHFTWTPEQAAVRARARRRSRPRSRRSTRARTGASCSLADAAAIAPLYPRLADFRRLVERLDPRGAFRNAWLERRVLGGT